MRRKITLSWKEAVGLPIPLPALATFLYINTWISSRRCSVLAMLHMNLSFFLCLPRGCWKWNVSLYLRHGVLTEQFLLWGKAQCFLSACVLPFWRPCWPPGRRDGLTLWLWPILQIWCPDNKKPCSGKFHKTFPWESQAAGRTSTARWYNIPQNISTK